MRYNNMSLRGGHKFNTLASSESPFYPVLMYKNTKIYYNVDKYKEINQ